MTEEFKSFEEFWPFYVSEHADKTNRRLHFVGSTLSLGVVATAVLGARPSLLLAAPVVGYGFAWVGHFFVEHNRPATFKYPLWSFRGDWVMWSKMIAGTMDAEVERCVALRRAATEPQPEPITVPRTRDLSVS